MTRTEDDETSDIWIYDLSRGTFGRRTFSGTVGSEDIYFMDFSGTEVTTTSIVISTRNDTNVSVSPDGNWFAYESGNQVFILPFPNSEDSNPIQITTDSGEAPRWGSGGDHIYYYLDGNLMRVLIDGESGSRLGAPEIVLTGLSKHGRASCL